VSEREQQEGAEQERTRDEEVSDLEVPEGQSDDVKGGMTKEDFTSKEAQTGGRSAP
jgi:hypothetical protein